MKSVGIKVLKNKLSSYLRYVREGEVVLVTDRDEVVAEIRRPARAYAHPGISRTEAFLEDCIGRGVMTRPELIARFPKSAADLPKPPRPAESAKLLDESRSERF